MSTSPSVHNMRDFGLPPDPSKYVYVGRPTKWGNPFKLGEDGNRAQVIEKYRVWLYDTDMISEVWELRGKDLICWCYPAPCHADVLLEMANVEA